MVNLATGVIGMIQNVKLLPSTSVARFVVSSSPAASYGPLAGNQEYVLTF